MTTLSVLKTMKDEDIQTWLLKIGGDHAETLVTAMLGADNEVLACVMRNMSSYARRALQRDIIKAQALQINQTVINKKAAELEKLL